MNYIGSSLNDVIDVRKSPFKYSTFSVYRSGDGDDLIILVDGKVAVAGLGNDTVIGVGVGIKSLKYDESPSGVEVDVVNGIAKDGYGTFDKFRGINSFFGSSFSDFFRGSKANEIFGSQFYIPQGNDTYIGGGGFDVVYYFSKAEDFIVKPDLVNDTATVTYSKTGTIDTLNGISEIRFLDKSFSLISHRASRETIYGSSENDILYAGLNPYFLKTGGETYIGAGGFDVLSYPGISSNFNIQGDSSNGKVSVSWIKEGGTDSLEGIALLRFDDKTVLLSKVAPTSQIIEGSSANELLYSIASRYGVPGYGDSFQGGGGYDVAIYHGQSTDFKVQTDSVTGLTSVVWRQGAVDTLSEISGIQFIDKFIDLPAYSPTKDSSTVLPNVSWQQISKLRSNLQSDIDGRPIGFNLQKIWYENFQVPSEIFNTRTFATKVDASPITVIGYGTSTVREDGSVLVIGGGWDPLSGKNGRLFTAVFNNNLLTSSNVQSVDGATHFFALNSTSGLLTVVGLGSDEGSLSVSGTAYAPSVFLDPQTLSFRQDPSLTMYAHNTQAVDYNGDGLMDLITTGGSGPEGGPSLLRNKGDGTLEAIPLLAKLPGAIGSFSIGWLGKQPDGTYAFALGGPNTVANKAFVPERNCVVYLNEDFTQLVRVQQLPTPIFEDPVYKGIPLVYEGWLGNEGTSHDMNIRTADINGDGRIDILMGSKIAAKIDSKGFDRSLGVIQFLVAQPDGSFKDETQQRLFNFDTTFAGPHHFEFRDINGDGFLDILTAEYNFRPLEGGSGFEPNTHAFYVLENDGTGHYIAVVHTQLANLQDSDNVSGQFGVDAQGSPFWLGWNTVTGANDEVTLRLLYLSESLYTGPNLSNPALSGAPGYNEFYYLLHNPDVQALRDLGAIKDGLTHYLNVGQAQGRAPFALNAWVQGSAKADLIVLREGNEKAFGGDGDDTFQGLAGNDSIDGGIGIDTAKFSGTADNFKISITSSGCTITDKRIGFDGIDSLVAIERLKFTDKSIAIDITGNAGITAKILGAVFGKESLNNKNYVGIGLHFLDGGWTYDNLAALALDATGAKSNDQIVSLLWTNVIGTKPTAADKQPFIALLDNGMSAGALAHLAANTSFNTTNINLVGLAQTGIEYIPVS